MAGRHYKEGLDYFELDCHLDEKIRLIQAEYGLKGYAVVVLLFQRIYGEHGYYLPWDDDQLLLFMSENGVAGGDKNLINEIVSACIRRDVFSKVIFDEYHVLTSHGIQKRYLKAIAKRENKNLKKEYLLLSDGKNTISDGRNTISDGRNTISDGRNAQRREENINTLSIYPTLDQIRSFVKDNGLGVNPESFYHYYSANGWVQGSGKPILDWRAQVMLWELRSIERAKKIDKGSEKHNKGVNQKIHNFEEREYDYDRMEELLIKNRGEK